MKSMIVAAVAALSLGIGAAYAQGLPPNVGQYGSQATNQSAHEGTVFLGRGTVFSKIFGHWDNGQAVADRAATSTRG